MEDVKVFRFIDILTVFRFLFSFFLGNLFVVFKVW